MSTALLSPHIQVICLHYHLHFYDSKTPQKHFNNVRFLDFIPSLHEHKILFVQYLVLDSQLLLKSFHDMSYWFMRPSICENVLISRRQES